MLKMPKKVKTNLKKEINETLNNLTRLYYLFDTNSSLINTCNNEDYLKILHDFDTFLLPLSKKYRNKYENTIIRLENLKDDVVLIEYRNKVPFREITKGKVAELISNDENYIFKNNSEFFIANLVSFDNANNPFYEEGTKILL